MIEPSPSSTAPTTQPTGTAARDRGTALPLVMVITMVLGALVVSISTYAATNLRYGHVTSDRSDRLSAADAGMRYAIDQLKLRNAACIIDTTLTELPRADVDFNEASATVACRRIAGDIEAIQAWAAVITGAGIPNSSIISTQGGNAEPKILGGPVYMSRVDSSAFQLGPILEIENGPLYYYDGGSCSSPVTKGSLPSALRFTPDLIFGPICTRRPWTELFPSPAVSPNVFRHDFPRRDGTVPRPTTEPVVTDTEDDDSDETDPVDTEPVDHHLWSYTDVGQCRVFEPGHYITPPDMNGQDVYFKTGEYVFDNVGAIDIRQGVATAGRPNPVTTIPAVNEIPPHADCFAAQQDDNPGDGTFGATFYMAGNSRINVLNQGSLEIHAREQQRSYVSIHAVCDDGHAWCTEPGPGGRSTLNAAGSGTENIVFTSSGNNRELVAHGLIYAPLARMEFGNVTNTAVQKLYGGLVIGRLILQSSASAQNFEIAVPTSPITSHIELTSTATKNGETSIRAVVEYRPYEENIADRIAVNSWRVCDSPHC